MCMNECECVCMLVCVLYMGLYGLSSSHVRTNTKTLYSFLVGGAFISKYKPEFRYPEKNCSYSNTGRN